MRFAALYLALPVAAVMLAQPVEQRLEIDEVVNEAVRRNPEILAAQKEYEAARQRPAQERALPDPMFSAGWNSSGNPLPGAGIGKEPVANAGAMISQEIPYPGKLRLKAEVASKEADAAAQEFRAVQLDVISRVKQAYFRLQHTYAMQDLLTRNRDLLRSLLRVTEARYSVGKVRQADVFKAQTQLTLIETRLLQLERERIARIAELNALMNRPPDAPLARPVEPHMMPLGFALDDLMAKARDAAPMLARDRKVIERSETALQLARKDFYPDFAVNGGYYFMGSMPPMYMFRADVKLPLRLGKRRAAVAEQAQEVAKSKHSYEADARSLEFRLKEDYVAAETAERLVNLYQQTVIPQAQLAVDASLASYQTGASDFTTVLSNYVAALEYEMNYHEQMQEYHLALARLEQMTGVELAK
jgi:cobalt-zinc-cadmium efflux system outer membrane protein